MTAPKLIKIICDQCGSENVGRDASVSWNAGLQLWELECIFDNGFCNDCGSEKCLKEVEFNEELDS